MLSQHYLEIADTALLLVPVAAFAVLVLCLWRSHA
jgi:hypothetical protein